MIDDLDELDAAQMEADMRRAQLAPGAFFFPRVLNETESRKVEEWIWRNVIGTPLVDVPLSDT
jgi:hypothetical protein